MAIQTIAASTFSISPTLPATIDQAGFDALSDWVEIGEVSNTAGHGDEYTEVTYDAITTRRTRKLKGTVNGGSETYTFASDITDTGQVALQTGLASDANVSVMETWQDGTVEYFLAKVMSYAGTGGGSNTVRERTCTLGIDSETITVAP